jgi:hypothetical protein
VQEQAHVYVPRDMNGGSELLSLPSQELLEFQIVASLAASHDREQPASTVSTRCAWCVSAAVGVHQLGLCTRAG